MNAMTDTQEPQVKRKPRIALMGEFSAGKSTLTNLLIGEPVLPVQVTATQLPPVWISQGNADPVRVDLHGEEFEVALQDVGHIDIAATNYIRVHRQADILDFCDIIDMPGISDPNMAPEVWERVVHNADAVVWCSHATQAWRQSEAAVWETMPQDLQKRSLLLLTRFDKITNLQDRKRVVRRVVRETDGLFASVHPISLIDAIRAGDDRAKWEQSGAEDFVGALIELLHELAGHEPAPMEPVEELESAPSAAPENGGGVAPRRVAVRSAAE